MMLRLRTRLLPGKGSFNTFLNRKFGTYFIPLSMPSESFKGLDSNLVTFTIITRQAYHKQDITQLERTFKTC